METKKLEEEANEDGKSLSTDVTSGQSSDQNMTTPNDGSTVPAGFQDMQPRAASNSSNNFTSAHMTNVTVNGTPYTVNITGEESASDLEADKKQALED